MRIPGFQSGERVIRASSIPWLVPLPLKEDENSQHVRHNITSWEPPRFEKKTNHKVSLPAVVGPPTLAFDARYSSRFGKPRRPLPMAIVVAK